MMSSPSSKHQLPQFKVNRLARRRSRRGYSLVELSTTVTIVGVLSTLATYSVRERVNEAHSIEALNMLGSVQRGVAAKAESSTGSGDMLEIGGRVGGFGGPLGLPGVLGKPGKNQGKGTNKDGGIDGDGNNGHGNNPSGCDPDNPGKGGPQCGGSRDDSGGDAGHGNNQGKGTNKDGGIDGDGNNGHGNNPSGCDPDNPGKGGPQCGGDGDDGGGDADDGGTSGGDSGAGDSGGGDNGGGSSSGGGDSSSDGGNNGANGGDEDGGDSGFDGGSGTSSDGEVDPGTKLCGSANPVPSSFAQVSGRVYQAGPGEWSTGSASQGWKCLEVTMGGAQRYQYGYDVGSPTMDDVPAGQLPEGMSEGSRFTAWARGDLDGDGRTSWFVVQGGMVDDQLITSPSITIVDQNE